MDQIDLKEKKKFVAFSREDIREMKAGVAWAMRRDSEKTPPIRKAAGSSIKTRPYNTPTDQLEVGERTTLAVHVRRGSIVACRHKDGVVWYTGQLTHRRRRFYKTSISLPSIVDWLNLPIIEAEGSADHRTRRTKVTVTPHVSPPPVPFTLQQAKMLREDLLHYAERIKELESDLRDTAEWIEKIVSDKQ